MSKLQELLPANEGQGCQEAAVANLRAIDAVLKVDGSDDAFEAMFQALRPLFAFDHAMVLDAGGDQLRCIAAVPAVPLGRSWSGGFLQAVIAGRVLVFGPGADPAASDALPPDLLAAGQSALAFPISVLDRRAAVLLVREPGGERFGRGHVALARVAAVVTLAALAARSGDRLEAEIQRLGLLVDRLRQSERSAKQDYDLLREIVELLPCGVTVQDEQGHALLVNAAAAGIPQDQGAGGRLQPITAGSAEDLSVSEHSVTGESGERTWLTSRRPVRIFDRTLLLSSSTDITERKQAENAWSRRAYFDDLTGLPNHLFIQQRVANDIRRIGAGGRVAIAFLDIDNFKHVNDYYSHQIGDALLIKVAARIAGHLRESDVLARVSGDEFLVLFDPVEDADQVRTLIDQILADLKRPFQVDAFEIFTSASIGISLYPEHGDSYETLRRNADTAMYRIKGGTKGAALLFDTEMGRSITARMEHDQQLRLAIRDNRFCCAFQAKVEIYTQQVFGFETLVRWRDENGENRSPGTFISLAVELGLIDTITRFVLAETLKSVARLDDTFGPGTTFSVNVPAQLAGDVGFMDPFIDTLKSSACAERIMLELTEETFVATNPFQTQVLPKLRDIGVGISIDDFGTGYSSLAALADITADELKVDRSFITGIHQRPRSQSVLKSIESLGQALGMSIVAEGVETIEELAYLQEATRIRYAQGYYFCKPFFLEEASGTKISYSDNRGGEVRRERLEANRVRIPRGRAY